MARLTIHLLGPPRIERDGIPIAVDTRKATALLAYLAVAGQPQPREALAALLWPESDEARSALRRTLSTLNHALAGVGLEIERDVVGLGRGPEVWVDFDEFRSAVAACQSHDHSGI